jgi:hypothetical protein
MLPTVAQGVAAEQMPEQLYSSDSVPMASGWIGWHTRPPPGAVTVSYPGAQVHCPFEQ